MGLTGGIGSGKSVVAARLAALGAVIVDSDRIAREVVAAGTEGLDAVVEAFGSSVLGSDGGLDRAKLGEIVFADNAARSRLEAIIHPRVRHRSAELFAVAPPDAIVVNDVPLLVEVGLAPTYHLVFVVETDPQVRVGRLVRDRGMIAEQAYQRISAQAGDDLRRAAGDVVLRNEGAIGDLHAGVDALWRDRLVPYERNVRRRIAVPTAEPVCLVPTDPTWPAQFARVAARIRHAVTPAGAGAELRIDHVGSTAVPGLAAKDTIDIQLSGPGDGDSLGWADELADRLAEAGFPPFPGQWWDEPRGAEAGRRWPKRMHGSADPGRRVNLHLRVAGTAPWQDALLVRDHLRADPARSAAYQAVKRGLAERGLGVADYVRAKEPWFDEEIRYAQEWAAETGWRP